MKQDKIEKRISVEDFYDDEILDMEKLDFHGFEYMRADAFDEGQNVYFIFDEDDNYWFSLKATKRRVVLIDDEETYAFWQRKGVPVRKRRKHIRRVANRMGLDVHRSSMRYLIRTESSDLEAKVSEGISIMQMALNKLQSKDMVISLIEM